MEPNEIRAELLRNNVKVNDIARDLGIKAPCVSAVISGRRPTAYIREVIAGAIGRPVGEVWPAKAVIKES